MRQDYDRLRHSGPGRAPTRLELWYAARNIRALKARGTIEYGRRHYPLIVLLHASWLTMIAIGIHRNPAVRALSADVLRAVASVTRLGTCDRAHGRKTRVARKPEARALPTALLMALEKRLPNTTETDLVERLNGAIERLKKEL